MCSRIEDRMDLNDSNGRSPDLPTALTTGYDRKPLPIDPTRMDAQSPQFIRRGYVVFQRKTRWPRNHKECSGVQEGSQVRPFTRLS